MPFCAPLKAVAAHFYSYHTIQSLLYRKNDAVLMLVKTFSCLNCLCFEHNVILLRRQLAIFHNMFVAIMFTVDKAHSTLVLNRLMQMAEVFEFNF